MSKRVCSCGKKVGFFHYGIDVPLCYECMVKKDAAAVAAAATVAVNTPQRLDGIRKNSMICKNCGTEGSPITHTQGSFLMEFILWLCFLIPGIIYSVWRITTRKKVCSRCQGNVIPLDTPMGKKFQSQMQKLATN